MAPASDAGAGDRLSALIAAGLGAIFKLSEMLGTDHSAESQFCQHPQEMDAWSGTVGPVAYVLRNGFFAVIHFRAKHNERHKDLDLTRVAELTIPVSAYVNVIQQPAT